MRGKGQIKWQTMDHRPLNGQIMTRFPKMDGSLLGYYEKIARLGHKKLPTFQKLATFCVGFVEQR